MNKKARRSARVFPFSALCLCAGIEVACGGSESTARAPEAAPPAKTADAPPSAAAPAAEAPSAAAPIPPPEADTKPAAPSTDAPPPGGKSITYRMTPSGLVVDLDGVQLEPHAEPIKLGGGWGVKLVVRAKVVDEREHRLQSPSKGPLMVAEEIDRGGKKELVPDERDGDGDLLLEKTSTPLERELRKPITAGQSLTLYVGLWGFGTSPDDRKPIKKLFVVKMVAGSHKPQPVVSAPE